MTGPTTPERILIIRPSALGDVCRTVPLLASLRSAFPTAHIAWLVQKGFEDAIAHHPALNEPIAFERHRMALKRLHTHDARRALLELLTRLRRTRFDLVIDAQGLGRSGLFTLATGAPRRIGHRQAREAAWLAYSHRVSSPPDRHTVDRMLDLVRALHIPPIADLRLHAGPAAMAWAQHTLDPGRNTPSPRTVVLAPTSRWPGKRWPIERFDALAAALLDNTPSEHETVRVDRIVIVGGPDERAQCAPLLERAQRDPRVIDLVGTTSIARLMAVIARADLVVAGDTAAIHMAVGFGRPLLALFGPTRVDLVGPYGRTGDVLQPEPPPPGASHKDETLGHTMMRAIELDSVIQACRARLRHAIEPLQ